MAVGYQTTGYFAPTSRFGTPQDFDVPVDHSAPARIESFSIGLPSPSLPMVTAAFSITHCLTFDSRQGFHQTGRQHLHYGRAEVRSFLMSVPCLARHNITRTDAGRCGSVHVLLDIRARGRVDSNNTRRRTWRPSISCGDFNERCTRSIRNPDDAEDRPHVADGIAAGVCRRVRLRHEWDMGWMHDT